MCAYGAFNFFTQHYTSTVAVAQLRHALFSRVCWLTTQLTRHSSLPNYGVKVCIMAKYLRQTTPTRAPAPVPYAYV